MLGTGDVSRSLQHPMPPLEVNFVSKGGTLEIPLTGIIGKVDKFCCLANTAIVQMYYRIVSP